MKCSIRLGRIALSLGAAGMLSLVGAGTAAATPAVNLLNPAYYTVNGTSGFCRYQTPQSSVAVPGGTASQSNTADTGPLTVSINGATGYADNGFYSPVGTLGNLTGYTVSGTGSQFATNLYLDTNKADDATNGAFFAWNGSSPDCYTGLGGDVYGLGPQSSSTGGGQSLTVNDSSQFSNLP